MKIALIGYGKMGRAIENIALSRGHMIEAKIDASNTNDLEKLVSNADVAIEFTRPEAAVRNIETCIDLNIPIVVGTTGWNEQLHRITKKVEDNEGGLLHASNFSVGVNLFFELNKRLAQMMNLQKEYQVQMQEIHHTQKLDEPSGTAISIANQIESNHGRYSSWHLTSESNSKSDSIPIEALREGEVKGTHEVNWNSSIDTLTIKHEAHSREGFASGAVIAAEWLQGKRGVFTMQDVLGL